MHKFKKGEIMMGERKLSEWMQDIEEILASKKLPNLETIMRLSRNVYEGAYINTEVVFTEDDPNDLIVRFESTSILPLAEEVVQSGEMKENRNVIGRMNKYCHMTNDTISLFATPMDMYNDAYAVIGIGQIKENTKWVARLKLEGHLKWTLQLSDDKKTIHYDGLFSEQIFSNSGIEIPEEFDSESTKIIAEIVNCAKKQKHGTMIVVLDEKKTKEEADRLCVKLYRGIRVNKFDLKKHLNDILVPITAIDGAVLIDKDGFCYGIGVILDGKATTPANSARGARFNSAYVYVNNMKQEGEKCLCIVVSEDGMVNPLCTQNIDNYRSEQINYDELCEENYIYNLNSIYDAYCEGELEWKEAQHSRLHGDPDCF